MYTHLKPREYYEDIYDRNTVKSGREKLASFTKFMDEASKKLQIEKEPAKVFVINLMYMTFVGNYLIDRYDNRPSRILEMMADDQHSDETIAHARLTIEPECQHCGKTGLRIKDKMLSHRNGIDSPEEVIFMLSCPHCDKNSSYWEDGTAWERKVVTCPRCGNSMSESSVKTKKKITTTYKCTSCAHNYKDVLDFSIKKDPEDPDYETDKVTFCLTDEKLLHEYKDMKTRFEDMAKWGRELKEREDNKEVYDALENIKKPKIAELSTILEPIVAKEGFIEFALDKPEMGRDVVVGFNCLDSKADRSDYESQKVLKKVVTEALKVTNWRLMTDGISYRLGYLSGRLKAYEGEEALKKLVSNSSK